MKNTYLKIFNIVIVILLILTFELGYCNHTFTKNIIQNKEITQFYMSPCRGIIYASIIAIVLIFNKKYNFDETIKLLQSKTKKVIFIIYAILAIITLVLPLFLTTTVNMTQYSLNIILLLTILIAIIYFSKEHTKNIILVGIVASILTVSTDTYHELDEKKYFMQSYNMSYFNIDFGNLVVDTMFMYQVTPRDSLCEYYKIDYTYIENAIENMPEEYRGDSTPANYNIIFFLASTLGIFIGRLFNGSIADIYVLGRLFNLILYIALIRYALKLMPFKKNILFLISSMPMLLALSASYSIDGLGFAAAMIFMASIFKIYDEKKTKLDRKTFLITFLSFVVLLCYKYMAYIFVGLLIFILPLKEIIKQNKKEIIQTFLIALGVLIALYATQLTRGSIPINDPRGGDTNAIGQVKNVITNPMTFAKAMYNFLNTQFFDFNWITSLHMDIFFGKTSRNVFLIILLYYFYVGFTDTGKSFSKIEKGIFISSFAITMLFITSIMYATFNPVGSEFIGGVQARYMYPVLPMLFVAISNNNLIKKDKEKDDNINVMIAQIGIMFISVLQTII